VQSYEKSVACVLDDPWKRARFNKIMINTADKRVYLFSEAYQIHCNYAVYVYLLVSYR
jgi:hypothetical protein